MSYDRPEIEHIWYAIGSFRKYHIEHHIGREVTPTANGRYIFSGGMGNPVYYDLEGGGKTKSCKREVIRVPKPKTRVETRWYRGHWQKYLKSKGWVAA
jgi:hypothetical protein